MLNVSHLSCLGSGINGSVVYFGPDVAGKRRELENYLVSSFRGEGFCEVVLPTVESFDILAPGIGKALYGKLYKFLDRHGRILILRPDITTPIAYLAATMLRHQPRPLKLFYVGSVFRAEEPERGKQEELYQADVEVIGLPRGGDDAGVIGLAIGCLVGAGLTDFRLGIGHAELLEGLMDILAIPDDLRERARSFFATRNFVGLSEIASELSLDGAKRRAFLEIPELAGDEEVLGVARRILEGVSGKAGASARERIFGSLSELGDIWREVSRMGFAGYACLDLGLARRLDYYTGVVFEAYARGVGQALLGGGRYDKLLEKFGEGSPAIGFALDLDRVVEALRCQNA